MKRKDLLTLLRVAGYHQNNALFTRLYIENRIGRETAEDEYRKGYSQFKTGVKCSCSECKGKDNYAAPPKNYWTRKPK